MHWNFKKQQIKEKNQEQKEAGTEEKQKDGNEMEIKRIENLPKLFITPTKKMMDEIYRLCEGI